MTLPDLAIINHAYAAFIGLLVPAATVRLATDMLMVVVFVGLFIAWAAAMPMATMLDRIAREIAGARRTRRRLAAFRDRDPLAFRLARVQQRNGEFAALNFSEAA